MTTALEVLINRYYFSLIFDVLTVVKFTFSSRQEIQAVCSSETTFQSARRYYPEDQHRPDDEGIKFLRNVCQYVPDYMAQPPRRQKYSYLSL